MLTTSDSIFYFFKPDMSKSKTCFESLVKKSFRWHLKTWENQIWSIFKLNIKKKLGEIWIGRFKIGCFASDELDRTKRRKKNLRFGRHKNECNFLLAASFHYFFQNKIHVPFFLQRRCVRKTKTKKNKTKQKSYQIWLIILY